MMMMMNMMMMQHFIIIIMAQSDHVTVPQPTLMVVELDPLTSVGCCQYSYDLQTLSYTNFSEGTTEIVDYKLLLVHIFIIIVTIADQTTIMNIAGSSKNKMKFWQHLKLEMIIIGDAESDFCLGKWNEVLLQQQPEFQICTICDCVRSSQYQQEQKIEINYLLL